MKVIIDKHLEVLAESLGMKRAVVYRRSWRRLWLWKSWAPETEEQLRARIVDQVETVTLSQDEPIHYYIAPERWGQLYREENPGVKVVPIHREEQLRGIRLRESDRIIWGTTKHVANITQLVECVDILDSLRRGVTSCMENLK